MGGNQMGSAPPPMVLRSLFHQYSTSTKLVPFYYTSQQCIEGEGNGERKRERERYGFMLSCECGLRNIGNEGDGLRLCSQAGCGRPKIRRHKFRRCSIASVEDDGSIVGGGLGEKWSGGYGEIGRRRESRSDQNFLATLSLIRKKYKKK